MKLCGIVCLVIGMFGCTVDSVINQDIGSGRVFLVASFLEPIDPNDPNGNPNAAQSAQWDLVSARLDLPGEEQADLDLLAGEDCPFGHTVTIPPTGIGPCVQGLLFRSNSPPQNATIELTFRLSVFRAKPVVLSPTGDIDQDTIPNGEDNCPFAVNPDQQDSNEDQIGDRCGTLAFDGSIVSDADGDGVVDSRDNCAFYPNASQTDTRALPLSGFTDSIGDACSTQSAEVESTTMGGDATLITIERSIPDFVQGLQEVAYLVVDFGENALSCNWDSGICTLDPGSAISPGEIDFCVQSDFFVAAGGCGSGI